MSVRSKRAAQLAPAKSSSGAQDRDLDLDLKHWENFLGTTAVFDECECEGSLKRTHDDTEKRSCGCARRSLTPASTHLVPTFTPSCASTWPETLVLERTGGFMASSLSPVRINAHTQSFRRATMCDELRSAILEGRTRCLLVCGNDAREIVELVRSLEPGLMPARIFIPAEARTLEDGTLRIHTLTEVY